MSIFVQAWVFAHSETQLADRLVLLAIADEADDDGTNAYPSQDRIAMKTRLSRSTVQRSISALEVAGAIVVTRPESTGRGKFNRYRILMGKTLGTEVGITEEGPEDEAFSAEKGPKRASPVTQDPRPIDQVRGKGVQNEALSREPARVSLGRGLDGPPLWELDDDGTLRWVGDGSAPRPAHNEYAGDYRGPKP